MMRLVFIVCIIHMCSYVIFFFEQPNVKLFNAFHINMHAANISRVSRRHNDDLNFSDSDSIHRSDHTSRAKSPSLSNILCNSHSNSTPHNQNLFSSGCVPKPQLSVIRPPGIVPDNSFVNSGSIPDLSLPSNRGKQQSYFNKKIIYIDIFLSSQGSSKWIIGVWLG